MPSSNATHPGRRSGRCWTVAAAAAMLSIGLAPRAQANGVPDPPPKKPCEARNWSRKDIKQAKGGYEKLFDAKFRRHIERQKQLLERLQREQGRNCTSCRAIEKELRRIEERKEARAKDCQRLLKKLKKNWAEFSQCTERNPGGDRILGGVTEGVFWKVAECEPPEKVCEYVQDMTTRLIYRAETKRQAWHQLPDCMHILYPDEDDLDALLYDKGGWLP